MLVVTTFCTFVREFSPLEVCGEIKIRFERRLGELLSEMPKAKGTKDQFAGRDYSGATKTEAPIDSPPTLPESSIDRLR